MDLRTFVKDVLCQLSGAIEDAQAELAPKGVRINPPYKKLNGDLVVNIMAQQDANILQKIDFDIAVTVGANSKSDGGASINVMGVKLGGSNEDSEISQTVSRLQFSVVAVLPQDKSGKHRS